MIQRKEGVGSECGLPMNKPFPRYRTRRVSGLAGVWDFAFLGDVANVNFAAVTFGERAVVPGAFDADGPHAGKRGVAIYRRDFVLRAGSSGTLEFEGVGMRARVLVDGTEVGAIASGWTPFSVPVPASDCEVRELIVVTDNRFNFETAPLHEPHFDFYQWGGITRAVWLHELPAQPVGAVVIDARPGSDLFVRIEFPGDSDVLQFEMDGVKFLPNDLARIDSRWVEAHFASAGLGIWSPTSPTLHTLRTLTPDDDRIDRFGIREVGTDGGRITINGEPVRIFGVNRHEAHGAEGPSLSDSVLLADLWRIRGVGGNCVRGSHYPQDQRFLDLCDEMGMLVWEEGLGWGQGARQFSDPGFQAQHRLMLEAMVTRSINHPSVILWGFLNEPDSHQVECRQMLENAFATVRLLDSSRLVTFASNHSESDLCLDLADVIAINTYPGWYNCEDHPDPLSLVEPALTKLASRLGPAVNGDRPLIISEIGVEALLGWRDAFNGFYTEEYQMEYLKRVCEVVESDERFAGVLIWHFSDARTYAGGRSMRRPRAYNNKGIFDEYRRPKRSAAWLASRI